MFELLVIETSPDLPPLPPSPPTFACALIEFPPDDPLSEKLDEDPPLPPPPPTLCA